MVLDSGVKILNISSYDHGGAGIASVVFNDYLLANGCFSRLLVRDTDYKNKEVIHYKKKYFPYIAYRIRKKRYSILSRRWRHLKRDNKFKDIIVFDDQNSVASAKSILRQAGFRPDIIFIHWTHNFITPEMLFELKRLTDAKIVSVMMDNAVITGGCHYPFGCQGYVTGCNDCPLFGIKTDFPALILKKKEALYPKDMEFWATTSDCGRVEKSILGRERRAYPILFPINENVLPTASKQEIRDSYNITADRKLVMIGCTTFNIMDNRKGYDYLISMLILMGERFSDIKKRVTLVLVGDNDEGILGKMGYDVLRFGYVPVDKLMELYKMSDLFLSTSIEDSGPLMVNQSIAVGTPVAAFNIGVAQDLIVDNETGFTADLYDFDALAIKIGEYLSSDNGQNMGENCIAMFRKKSEEISPLIQLQRILNS
ncbi:MAG: glycosyltransferase [Bacteroidales bacterium]